MWWGKAKFLHFSSWLALAMHCNAIYWCLSLLTLCSQDLPQPLDCVQNKAGRKAEQRA